MVSSGVSNNITASRPAVSVKYQTSQSEGIDFSSLITSQAKDSSTKTLPGNDKKNMAVDDFVPKASSVKTKSDDKISKDDRFNKISESDKDKITDIASKIKDKIKEKLEVTDEDIDNAMAALNLVITDLLNADNLSDVIMQVTGSKGMVDLLVSDGLSEAYTEILDFADASMEQFLGENDITQSQLEEILDSIKTDDLTADKADATVKKENAGSTDEGELSTAEEHKDNEAEILNREDVTLPHETAKKSVEYSFHGETSSQSDEKEIIPDNRNIESVKDNTVNFVTRFDEAINEVLDRQGLSEQVSPAQIVDQIVDTARITINRQTTSMEMTLNPESLGKINLNVSVREGVVTANIVAQNEVVKEVIESQIITLRENFNEQGIKVDAVTVTVESHAFNPENSDEQAGSFENHEGEQKKNHRPLRLDSLEDLSVEDLTEDEKLVLDIMSKQGNQVNFTA